MVLAMANVLSAHDFAATTSVGSVGVVAIDERTCTVCGQCTHICPTTALKLRQLDSALEITFDSVMCGGCSMCLTTCPERKNGAITLRTSFDVRELHRGLHTVCSSSTSRCEICQGPIAPSAMLDRIRSMLGPDHAGTVDLIGRRCIDCR
jgi:Pyruvate/2-oxoacid:ferredoxin oxidoreductase delta subunit